MMTYKEAVEEFGRDLADVMLEEEYNQFIRHAGYHYPKYNEEVDFFNAYNYEDGWWNDRENVH